jgi:3-oxoacyl-[acyl-carrier protein] reductase
MTSLDGRDRGSGHLRGQVVLVTGGNGGIGSAITEAAARAGADVAIGYIEDRDKAEALVRDIQELGCEAAAFRGDISDSTQARDVVAAVEERFGRIDGLVNNAGIMPTSPFLEMEDEVWDQVLRTNLYGTYYCCHAALPGMVERGSGAIVNIASRLGQIGWPQVAHYCAAKAGVIGLTKALAHEFGPRGIRVNAVAPGVTKTALAAGVMRGETGRHRLSEIPAGRFGEPHEVAAPVIFLLSEAASMLHGQTLNPNGGGFMP